MVQNSRSIRDMQAQEVFQDLKTLSVSCLASLYLLCFDQANDSTANLLHLYLSFSEKFVKEN